MFNELKSLEEDDKFSKAKDALEKYTKELELNYKNNQYDFT